MILKRKIYLKSTFWLYPVFITHVWTVNNSIVCLLTAVYSRKSTDLQ